MLAAFTFWIPRRAHCTCSPIINGNQAQRPTVMLATVKCATGFTCVRVYLTNIRITPMGFILKHVNKHYEASSRAAGTFGISTFCRTQTVPGYIVGVLNCQPNSFCNTRKLSKTKQRGLGPMDCQHLYIKNWLSIGPRIRYIVSCTLLVWQSTTVTEQSIECIVNMNILRITYFFKTCDHSHTYSVQCICSLFLKSWVWRESFSSFWSTPVAPFD